MKVLTFSKHYPAGHPKKGQETYFAEKIWNSFRNSSYSLPPHVAKFTGQYPFKGDEYLQACQRIKTIGIKHHTIRVGNRWKVGDMASLRVWSGAPYRSKQVEFAQVEVKSVWPVEINIVQTSPVIAIDGNQLTYEAGKELAANDGLSLTDFISWFNIHPKKTASTFRGQIICWSDSVNYTTGKPQLITEAK